MEITQAEQLGSAIVTLHPRQMGPLPLLYPILSDLGVRDTVNAVAPTEADIDLGRVVLLLTLNRLLAPQPLYQVHEWLAETVLPEVLGIAAAQAYDNRLGQALDRLYPHLGELWARIATRAVQVYAVDLSVLHWDITSRSFEGAYADSQLAAYGYSRDQRPDTKQVNLEVDVSHDGAVPVLYQVLSGNTADITRPPPHLRARLRFLARPELAERQLRPILVSDCKMITAEAVAACHRHDLYYPGPLPNSTAAEAVLRSVTTEELAAQPLAYRPQRVRANDPDFLPYQGVWRPFTCEHQGEQFTDRALVVWSAGKQRLDEQKRKTWLKRLLSQLAAIQRKLNTRRYKQRAYVEQRLRNVQEGNPARQLVAVTLTGEDGQLHLTFRIDRQRLAAQTVDGRYAIATNAAHLDADQALTLFKGQDGVEKCFRDAKGPLLAHPLYVRSDRRIEGLACITLLALLVRAILVRACRQQGLALSRERLWRGFTSLQAVDVVWRDGSRQRRAAALDAFQSQVLAALGWPGSERYADLTPLVR